MRKMRVALALAPLDDGDVRQQPVERGRAARRRHLPRPRVARRRSGSLGPRAVALWKKGARSTTTSSGRSTCRCSSSSATAEVIANTGQTFRSFWKSGFEGHHADAWTTGRRTSTRSSPRCASRRRSRSAAPTRRRRRLRVRAARAVDGHLLRRRARSPRPRRSSHGWTHDEVVAAARATSGGDGLRATFRGEPLAEVGRAGRRDRRGGPRAARASKRRGRQGRARAPRAPAQARRRGHVAGRRAARGMASKSGTGVRRRSDAKE